MTYLILLMAGGQNSDPYMQFIPLILVIFVFYFFILRPQLKKQKEANKYRESLKKGDEILTTGGLYGKVVEIKEDALILDLGNNVKVKVHKNAIEKDATNLKKK